MTPVVASNLSDKILKFKYKVQHLPAWFSVVAVACHEPGLLLVVWNGFSAVEVAAVLWLSNELIMSVVSRE